MAARGFRAHLAATALIAVAVLADRSRHDFGGQAVLLAVIAAASRLVLKDRRLIGAMPAFAIASTVQGRRAGSSPPRAPETRSTADGGRPQALSRW
jgi:hypothetical protein